MNIATLFPDDHGPSNQIVNYDGSVGYITHQEPNQVQQVYDSIKKSIADHIKKEENPIKDLVQHGNMQSTDLDTKANEYSLPSKHSGDSYGQKDQLGKWIEAHEKKNGGR